MSPRATRLSNAISQIQDGLSEVESLKDELEFWKENMDSAGTGLENTQKSEDLGTAVETLSLAHDNIENAVSELEGIENAVSELEGIEIPGMFG